jgi:hypothetical protein
MVRPERFELSTFSLGMKCSIHLSYGRTGAIIADFAVVYGGFGGFAAQSMCNPFLCGVPFAFLFAIPYVRVAARRLSQAMQ